METNKNWLKRSSILATVLMTSAALLSQSAVAQTYKTLTRIGTSQSVCLGGVQTEEQLQEFFANNPEKIRSILRDSGWTGSDDDLMAAVARGDLQETTFPIGTRFAWMGAKVDGKYVANPYREWGGSQPLPGFEMKVSSNCLVYHIAIPKACCNVSLLAVVEDNTSPECAPPPPPPPPAPKPEPIPEPEPVAFVPSWLPYVGLFAGTETRPRFEPAWQKDQVDSSGLYGIRAGLARQVTETVSIFGQFSYYDRNGVNEGNIFSDRNAAFDIGVDYHLSPKAFIGAGVGYWDFDDSEFSEASLFTHIGGDIGKSNFQWILEARIFDSDSERDSISDNKMFSAGLRYVFR